MFRLAALFIAAALAGCTSAEITPPGYPAPVKLTQVGGMVTISDPNTGGDIIRADNRESFKDGAEAVSGIATKLFAWKAVDRLFGRLDTRDTIEAAAARDAQGADLATLRETNQHSLRVLEAEQAFELEQAAIP